MTISPVYEIREHDIISYIILSMKADPTIYNEFECGLQCKIILLCDSVHVSCKRASHTLPFMSSEAHYSVIPALQMDNK